MLDYLEKEEKKALKKKRSKKVSRTKEPFLINPIYSPVTGSPDRTPSPTQEVQPQPKTTATLAGSRIDNGS